MSGLIWQTVSSSAEQTEHLGSLMGSRLKGGEVIELRADLGGGKTTFVRGLVGGAGSKARPASPTFTLNLVYDAPHFAIHHFDFYRLSEPGILRSQLSESISNKAVVIIEWSDIIRDILPRQRIGIEFKPVARDADERQISISYPQSYADLVGAVQTAWQDSRP